MENLDFIKGLEGDLIEGNVIIIYVILYYLQLRADS